MNGKVVAAERGGPVLRTCTKISVWLDEEAQITRQAGSITNAIAFARRAMPQQRPDPILEWSNGCNHD